MEKLMLYLASLQKLITSYTNCDTNMKIYSSSPFSQYRTMPKFAVSGSICIHALSTLCQSCWDEFAQGTFFSVYVVHKTFKLVPRPIRNARMFQMMANIMLL